MRLSKYHGLGNDFIIGHYDELKHLEFSHFAKKVCHRHTGVGADGLIIVKQSPLEMIYYNSDGSLAEMCGNGIRCFAAYCLDEKLVQTQDLTVQTLAGEYQLRIKDTYPYHITVDMGKVNYDPKSFGATTHEPIHNKAIQLEETTYHIHAALMGVPHMAIPLDTFNNETLTYLGKRLTNHTLFLDGVNVNFYEILSKDTIKMQTYERGAGLTLACGTGACATVAMLHHQELINNQVTVQLPLGELVITVNDNDHVIMTGPAEKIADLIISERSQYYV
ncbi:MAG: diaminopimelate epimerase [Candidatus Izemoplasma sp.]|nr:diaminopimelate epimerase [Candidatus Izemoplasma sp.]